MPIGDVLKKVEVAAKCEERGLKSEDPVVIKSLIQDLQSEFHENYKSILMLKYCYTELETGESTLRLQYSKDLMKVVRVIEGEKSKSYQKLLKRMMTLKTRRIQTKTKLSS